MRQYLLSIYQPDGESLPPEELAEVMAEVDRWRADLTRARRWVFDGGLAPAETATVVQREGSGFLTTDGPYVEGKEHVGGFVVIRATDLDDALQWGRSLAGLLGLPIEVRPFQV